MTTPYCIVPWIHAHVTSGGMRALCCLDKERTEFKPIKEWWNSDHMKQARLDMLKETPPPRCETCSSGVMKYREWFNDRYSSRIDSLVKVTAEDGTFVPLPITADYRTKVCNFSCKTCTPDNSTRIENTFKTVIPIQPTYRHDREMLELPLEDIHYAGGEPFAQKNVIELLEELVKTNRAKDISLQFNTNLSKLPDLKMLEKFKHIDMRISIDGVGEVGEYIRTGWEQELFTRNLRTVLASLPEARFILDVTLTNIGLVHLVDTMDYLEEFDHNRVRFRAMLEHSLNGFLSPYSVDKFMIRVLKHIEHPQLKETLELIEAGKPKFDRKTASRILDFVEHFHGQQGVYRRLLGDDFETAWEEFSRS